jgi:tetratricopeptide (TPR) repeat protein
MFRWALAGILLSLAVVLVACGSAPAPQQRGTIAREAPAASSTPAVLLPHAASSLAPAQTELTGALTGQTLTETESCAGCHADAAAQWRSSAHAFSSFNNPVYRIAVDRFRTVVGKDASRFCGGCHDAALLVDGAMSGEVQPSDPRGHGGVTCRVCHGIASARPDGNASYTLDASPIPIPRDGDAASLRAHKERMALAPLRTPVMCGSCHRSFLSPETGNPSHLVGQDELGAWGRSAYAGSLGARIDDPIERAECRTCHMPLEAAPLGDAAAKQGRIRSHRFAGAGTWLAAMRSDASQLEADGEMLRGAASIDVAAVTAADGTRTLPADGAPVKAGQPLVIDVVVRNERVGHRFPGGVVDAQDTWVQVEVSDARGTPVASAGALEEATGEDRSAHILRALQADENGTPVLVRETDRFRTAVFNHTVAPRDAEVVRYRLEVPSSLAAITMPLRVTARLRHRSRNLALARAVCEDAKTPRGQAFARETAARSAPAFDPCVREPVTETARGEVWIGANAEARPRASALPDWKRLYDHALGLLHALQEDVGGARASLERALQLVSLGPDRERAMLLHALAEVAVREGRTDEALGLLDQAEKLLPEHPAIAHARGEALGGVWRWKEAEAPLREAAEASPLDDGLWSHLAVAYGSAGDAADALGAAKRGLALTPRDWDMLRVQALALDRLSAPPDEAEQARTAFARWSPPDDAPGIKSACARAFAWCALERIPGHVHPLSLSLPELPRPRKR